MIHVMLPVQYLRKPGVRTDPQKRLMAAVLQTVVDDCRGSVHRRLPGERRPHTREALQADAYLTSTDRAWPFSFENLCEALSLDPDALRAELQNGRAR